MNILTFTMIAGAGAIVAGMLGSVSGLGGGVIIIPFLTLVLGVDIRYAIGASLISVLARVRCYLRSPLIQNLQFVD